MLNVYALPDGLSLPKSCHDFSRRSLRQILAWGAAGRSPVEPQVYVKFSDQAHEVRDRGLTANQSLSRTSCAHHLIVNIPRVPRWSRFTLGYILPPAFAG